MKPKSGEKSNNQSTELPPSFHQSLQTPSHERLLSNMASDRSELLKAKSNRIKEMVSSENRRGERDHNRMLSDSFMYLSGFQKLKIKKRNKNSSTRELNSLSWFKKNELEKKLRNEDFYIRKRNESFNFGSNLTVQNTNFKSSKISENSHPQILGEVVALIRQDGTGSGKKLLLDPDKIFQKIKQKKSNSKKTNSLSQISTRVKQGQSEGNKLISLQKIQCLGHQRSKSMKIPKKSSHFWKLNKKLSKEKVLNLKSYLSLEKINSNFPDEKTILSLS